MESGDGRYDIAMHPKSSTDCAVLLELKRGEEAHLASYAEEALEQIEQRHYIDLIRDFGHQGKILCYGIAAFKKHVAIKLKIL